jgi:hypothetical protein
MNVDVIETKSAATELVQDWGDERVVDEVAVDPVPVQCMLVILEVFWLFALAQPLHLVCHAQEGRHCVSRECAADDNVLRRGGTTTESREQQGRG